MDIVDPFTLGIPANQPNGPGAWVYWTMSTWVPYRVLLMRTAVSLEPRPEPPPGLIRTINAEMNGSLFTDICRATPCCLARPCPFPDLP